MCKGLVLNVTCCNFFFPPLFYVRVVGSGLLANFTQLCARAAVGKVRVLVTPRSPVWS